MIIDNIEQDRKKKVRSLFQNNIKLEVQDLKNILSKLSLTTDELNRIESTLDFAMAQKYGDTPILRYYVSHPIRVATLCAQWQYDTLDVSHVDMIITALIHNALEKQIMSPLKIGNQFGKWARTIIETITVDREAEKQPEWAKQYYLTLSSLDQFGQLLKAFDKFDNIYSLCINPDHNKRHSYLQEIEKYISPIIKNFAPTYMEYFEKLVEATYEIGYKPKEYFLNLT